MGKNKALDSCEKTATSANKLQKLDILMTRRSIRTFEPGEVLDEDINLILQAGIMAPSPGNRQPWRFHVIRNTTKSIIIEYLQKNGGSFNQVLGLLVLLIKRVPILLAVEVPSITNYNFNGSVQLTIADIGSLLGGAACVENMLLAIHALGYGSVWIGLPPILQATSAILETSGAIIGVLPIGIPSANQIEYINRSRKPVETVTIEHE